jgi:hypothetical protein
MEPKVVTAADWTRAGYQDGLHGNGSNPPSGPGSTESRKAYATGYQNGKAAGREQRTFRDGRAGKLQSL